MELQNKVAVITGAGRGIGRAIAVAYAKEGATLVLAARNVSELKETTSIVEKLGSSPVIVPTDVTRQDQVNELVHTVLKNHLKIDILVNNAGIAGPLGPIETNDVADWLETVNVNLIGTFLCCHAVIPGMIRQGGGKIINLAGAGAVNAWPNMSAYCSSKVAVVRLTEVLALELENYRIMVNALSPGSVHTKMWDEMTVAAAEVGAAAIHETGLRVTSGGGASIDDCAELAVFLASEASGQLSGRLVSSVTDDFRSISSKIPAIMASDAYTLRRVGYS